MEKEEEGILENVVEEQIKSRFLEFMKDYERDNKVYTEIVPNCKKKILQKIILGKIDKDSIVVTDFWKGYSGLIDVGYGKHIRLNHKKGVWTDGRGHI